MLLELDGVTTYRGFVPANREVSINVAQGEVVSLLGSNGAGKTTMLLTISGILRPSKGKIRFEGQEIQGLAPHRIVKKGISHSPEDRKLFGKMSVAKNLRLGAYIRRKEKKAIRETMERVLYIFPILGQRANQMAQTLSGGEQKMLAIGRALMANPKLLMLDEPSLGLAPKITQMIMETFRVIRQTGTTILIVEQNAAAALKVADRGYVLKTGKVVLDASRDELLSNEDVKKAYLGA